MKRYDEEAKKYEETMAKWTPADDEKAKASQAEYDAQNLMVYAAARVALDAALADPITHIKNMGFGMGHEIDKGLVSNFFIWEAITTS